MKNSLFLLLCFPFFAVAQQPQFVVLNLSLPEEIAFYDNQFSSLYIQHQTLFLMSESRLQDGAEGKLYAIALADLDRKLRDTAYQLPWKKYGLVNLEKLREKIAAAGQRYEGLEAMIIDSNVVYLSVETATSSANCYLLKGILNDTAVVMNPDFLIPIPKFTAANGAHIYNAGFEALAKKDNRIFLFFEFNNFPSTNYVYQLNDSSTQDSLHLVPITPLPFRITDMTHTTENHFTAINYFYKGGDADTIYRTPANDSANNRLIKDGAGYKSYCRLIDVVFNKDTITWKPLWEFPPEYREYNWEGIAAYKNGYFIINDKYTPKRPYRSTLLYVGN